MYPPWILNNGTQGFSVQIRNPNENLLLRKGVFDNDCNDGEVLHKALGDGIQVPGAFFFTALEPCML